MGSIRTRFIAVLVVCAAVAAGLASRPAGALTPSAHSPSVVGTYDVYVMAGTPKYHKGSLAVNADGTTVDGFGKVGTWSSRGKAVMLVFAGTGILYVFEAVQTNHGLASKKHPGTWTANGMSEGVWYGKRTS
jgi:hypothetical protein